MFRSVFRPYGRLWNFLNTVTDVLGLSILWCFCCLPVLTIAPATTALYDAAVHGIRYGEGEVYRRFFRTFRKELKLGACVTLLWGAILLLGAFILALLQEAGQENSRAALMAGAYHAVLAVPLAAACWSVMIQSRFVYGFRELTAMAVRYLPVHLLASAAVAVFTWVVFWFCCSYPLSLTYAPALCVLGWSFPAEHIFRGYGAGLEEQQEPEE